MLHKVSALFLLISALTVTQGFAVSAQPPVSNSTPSSLLTTDLLFGLVGVLAFFFGAIFPIYGACAGDYFPREVMGTVIGAWTPFYGLGAIMVHWVTGILRDQTGVYDHAFSICIATALFAILLISPLKKAQTEITHVISGN